MSNTTVPARLLSSTTLTVVGRSATVNITLTNGVLAVVARSGTVNVGVT